MLTRITVKPELTLEERNEEKWMIILRGVRNNEKFKKYTRKDKMKIVDHNSMQKGKLALKMIIWNVRRES